MFASEASTTMSVAARRLFLGSLALLLVLMALAVPRAASAQTEPGPITVPSISVVGFGEAEAPAESATIQLVLNMNDPSFGGPTRSRPSAEPGVEEREAVAPIVELIVSNGVAEEDVAIVTSLALGDIYSVGVGGVIQLSFPVAQPTQDGLNQLIDTVIQAINDEGLFVQFIGAGYEVADCAPLQRQAREAAIADARAQAEVQAELLGVELGDVIGSSDMPIANASPYGLPLTAGNCDPEAASLTALSGLGLGFSTAALPFDPTAEPVVEVYHQVTVTYAIAS